MPAASTPKFQYQDIFPLKPNRTRFRLVSKEHVRTARFSGQEMLVIEPAALTLLSREAMRDVSFLMRSSHFEQLAAILKDPEASDNDTLVALTLLENSEISAKFELPMCQDTGTAIVMAKKGQRVWTGVDDAQQISHGIWKTYKDENLRFSQVAALSLYEEKNTGTNLPAQIDIAAVPGMEYKFLFMAKGGGSANKSYLFQETKALLNPASLKKFLVDKMKSLGTAACPPYHLAFVIGGTSAEMTLKTVKLASARYLDGLPSSGNLLGRAFRDLQLEAELLQEAYRIGIGAQFGGKYFALDARVIRLPRHGASCPIGIGVSCSADRNILAKIDKKGLWVESLETNPGRFIPPEWKHRVSRKPVSIDLQKPMPEILSQLTQHPVSTALALNGRLIVARDIAHAKIKERLDKGLGLPQYFKDHPVYYAGPAKTPKGMPSGSFGPTTSSRMDPYVAPFQAAGGSLVMIGKGNRSPQVAQACKKYRGFYLGSIGGPAAILARNHIRKVQVLDFPELGMEAVWAIDVENFPAFILVDDKGGDFFAASGAGPES